MKPIKWYNSIKSVGGVKVLVLCTSPDNIMLYICTKFCHISKGFGITDLDSKVHAVVEANVDRKTYVRIDGIPDPFIAPDA